MKLAFGVGTALVFGAMLMTSNKKIETLKRERDQARHELVDIVPKLERQMEAIKQRLDKQLQDLYNDHQNLIGDRYEVPEPDSDPLANDSVPVTNE